MATTKKKQTAIAQQYPADSAVDRLVEAGLTIKEDAVEVRKALDSLRAELDEQADEHAEKVANLTREANATIDALKAQVAGLEAQLSKAEEKLLKVGHILS